MNWYVEIVQHKDKQNLCITTSYFKLTNALELAFLLQTALLTSPILHTARGNKQNRGIKCKCIKPF